MKVETSTFVGAQGLRPLNDRYDLNIMTEMQTEILSALEAKGAVLQDERVRQFGSVTDEYAGLESAVLIPLLGTTPLRLTGQDRLEFLHGQVSNDVKGLKAGQRNQSLMLNHKGHALAEMRVYRREDDVFAAVEGGAGAFVRRELEAHIIFDQVEIQNLSEVITSFTLQGNSAQGIIQSVFEIEMPPVGNFIQVPYEGAKVLLASVKRSLQGGVDIHVLSKDAETLLTQLLDAGAMLAGEDVLNIARVEANIPSAEFEGGEGALPQEVGLEPAVSYRKGCYLGQEIMARIEARGNLRKELKKLSISAFPDSESKNIISDGKSVGRLGTVVEHPEQGVLALASVRKDVGDGGLELEGTDIQLTIIT